MKHDAWTTKRTPVASLHLDPKNPRLGREVSARAPREIIQHLFDHDKAMDIAESIATRGYFPNEPLLAIKEGNQLVVVEGNRRLAALKALREPGLLEGKVQRQIERLARQVEDPGTIASVPVTLAPSRRATDKQIAGRHVGTPVLAWQAENRASFILDKLAEGYSNEQLRDQLGFALSDIQAARQTRAVADMARSLELPDEVRAKLDNPRAKLFTTLERVIDSSVGREYLKVEKDPDHGIRGTTNKAEFVRVFTQLVSDVALGKQSSRTLNTNEDIESYFKKWHSKERKPGQRGSFVPADIVKGHTIASSTRNSATAGSPPKAKSQSQTVLPRDFKVRHGNERLVDIRRELGKLKRDEFPNAGAVLLRVFFELTVVDYLRRTGELEPLVKRLEQKTNGKLPHGVPKLSQLVPEVVRVARAKLSVADASKVERAVKYDAAAPFTISELHAFVHHTDLPSPRDIQQFWSRTEPIFRLMLETDEMEPSK